MCSSIVVYNNYKYNLLILSLYIYYALQVKNFSCTNTGFKTVFFWGGGLSQFVLKWFPILFLVVDVVHLLDQSNISKWICSLWHWRRLTLKYSLMHVLCGWRLWQFHFWGSCVPVISKDVYSSHLFRLDLSMTLKYRWTFKIFDCFRCGFFSPLQMSYVDSEQAEYFYFTLIMTYSSYLSFNLTYMASHDPFPWSG